MKGPKAEEEIKTLRRQNPSLQIKTIPLRLPLTGDQRLIVVVKGSPS
jgi:hypothetical protein